MGRRIKLAAAGAAALMVVGCGTVALAADPTTTAPVLTAGTGACTTNTAGVCTLTHTLGVVPDTVVVSPVNGTQKPYMLNTVAGSYTATAFQVRAMQNATTPRANVAITVSWVASKGTVAPPPPPSTSTVVPPPTTTPGTSTVTPPPPTTSTVTPPPTTTTSPPPPVTSLAVCGTAALNGPATAPAGAVTVPAGVNNPDSLQAASTAYWFAPGTHTIGTGQYSQITPSAGSTYIGAPGAVLDGQGKNQYAFTQHATNVKIQYLTIRGFIAPRDEGVVNHDSGDGWTLEHNTFVANKGAALMSGSNQVMRGNCFKDNGQYGLNAYQDGAGPKNLTLDGNEFVNNNTDNWEAQIDGCGCTGGMKFWSVNGATITNNWIHDNRSVGLWADTNNNDFLIKGNLFEKNDSAAIIYETSYNAAIQGNTFRNNDWVEGKAAQASGDNFPYATVYLSESGGDARVPARFSRLDVSGNTFDNNWSGLTLWENADRFCNSPANTSSGDCTVGGSATISKCVAPGINSEPLYSDCRWKTQRVDVHDNTFSINTTTVGCNPAYCGHQGLLSNYGTYPTWSPYKGWTVADAITKVQDNHFANNTYTGTWGFVSHDQDTSVLSLAQWQATGQDVGSVVK